MTLYYSLERFLTSLLTVIISVCSLTFIIKNKLQLSGNLNIRRWMDAWVTCYILDYIRTSTIRYQNDLEYNNSNSIWASYIWLTYRISDMSSIWLPIYTIRQSLFYYLFMTLETSSKCLDFLIALWTRTSI